MKILSIEEYRALFQHLATALAGPENLPASFSEFLERIEQAENDETMEQDSAMALFSAAYQRINEKCNHSLKHTLAYLQTHHSANYRQAIELIIWLGGHCDCEVLMNVSPADYAQRCQEPIDHKFTAWEWDRLIDNYLLNAGYRHTTTKQQQSVMQQSTLW